MNQSVRKYLVRPLLAAVLLWLAGSASGQASYDGMRWFQIELSIFSNEYPEYRNAEFWSPERLELTYPPRSREFASLAGFLQVRAFPSLSPTTPTEPGVDTGNDAVDSGQDLPPDPVGPFPQRASGVLRMPDFARDPYLLLPGAQSEFQTTNARLERSPVNRLLFTGVWRQPVLPGERAQALIVRGGRQAGARHELEGSVTLRFNQNEDRVVIDADLWLLDFAPQGGGDPAWQLPPLPPAAQAEGDPANTQTLGVNRIVQMRQSRDMRSNEFHYLDHPALGLVVSVKPYDLPLPLARESAADEPATPASVPELPDSVAEQPPL